MGSQVVKVPMRILAVGNSPGMTRFRTPAGFTLLELLVVTVLIGVAAAAVASSLPRQSARSLRAEANHLATVLETQRLEAISNEVAQVLIFKKHELFTERKNVLKPALIWSSDAIEVTAPSRWVTGPEPFGSKLVLQVVSHDDPAQTLYVGTDGIRSFSVKNAASEWLE